MIKITSRDIELPKVRGQKKGDNGRLLLIGGSDQYPGAVALAGIAALRSGCDWVTVACPEKVAWAVNALCPDLVTVKLKGEHIKSTHKRQILELAGKHDCLLIGNGIGLKSGPVVKAICKLDMPKVIDADAIKCIGLQDARNSILTPHKGEYERLIDNSGGKDDPADNVIILKGQKDKIITKDKTYTNTTGNPGMTKAGTGDVLAGLCAGFLAQGLSLEQSAINGIYINGKAGDLLLEKKKGPYFIASDLAMEIENILGCGNK